MYMKNYELPELLGNLPSILLTIVCLNFYIPIPVTFVYGHPISRTISYIL